MSSNRSSYISESTLMTKNKILILGCPGAGKSTFANKLNNLLGLPLYRMDDLYWELGWKRVSNAILMKRLTTLSEEKSWIIEGNHLSTLDVRIKAADVVVFLDYSLIICLFRSIKRSILWLLGDKQFLPKEVGGGAAFL